MNAAFCGQVQRLVLPKLDTFGEDCCTRKYLQQRRNAYTTETQKLRENSNAEMQQRKRRAQEETP